MRYFKIWHNENISINIVLLAMDDYWKQYNIFVMFITDVLISIKISLFFSLSGLFCLRSQVYFLVWWFHSNELADCRLFQLITILRVVVRADREMLFGERYKGLRPKGRNISRIWCNISLYEQFATSVISRMIFSTTIYHFGHIPIYQSNAKWYQFTIIFAFEWREKKWRSKRYYFIYHNFSNKIIDSS